jgi:hypothetical protein
MSKIYCSIYNGIGNQLFGYALGLYLSKKYGKEIVLDLSKLNTINFRSRIGLKKDTIREFELDKIGFTDKVVQLNLRNFFKKITWLSKKKMLFFDFRESYAEQKMIDCDADFYCLGWGDFRIVNEILPVLRSRFIPKFEITEKLAAIKNVILKKNSVAVHLRGTDFLDKKINGFAIGLCTDEYYSNAIRFINENIANPYFIIFSDDPEYFKQKLKIENSLVVTGNKGYEDLYLMSLCKHFILANSTFSFWAAILNTNQNKTVCVPEYWYNSPRRQADYIPDDWTKIAID